MTIKERVRLVDFYRSCLMHPIPLSPRFAEAVKSKDVLMQSIAQSVWRIHNAEIAVFGDRRHYATALFFLANGARSVTLLGEGVVDWHDDDESLYRSMIMCISDNIDPFPIVSVLEKKSHEGIVSTVDLAQVDFSGISDESFDLLFSTPGFVLDKQTIPELFRMTRPAGEHHHLCDYEGGVAIESSDALDVFRAAGLAPQTGIFKDFQTNGLHLVRPENEYEEWLDEGDADPTSVAHVHTRYDAIAPLVKGKSVLDVGCGSGIGSRTMAKVGVRHLTGIDYSSEGITYAKEKMPEDMFSFMQHDLEAPLPFEDGAFDVAVCFEVLEHITSQAQLIDEIYRVLGDDGVFCISIPSRELEECTARVDGYENRYHLYTPSSDELRSLLAAFPKTRWYSQCDVVMSAIFPHDTGMTDEAEIHLEKVRESIREHESVVMAVCSKSAKPPCLDTRNFYAHSFHNPVVNSYKEAVSNYRVSIKMQEYAVWNCEARQQLWDAKYLFSPEPPVGTLASVVDGVSKTGDIDQWDRFLKNVSGTKLDAVTDLVANARQRGGVEQWDTFMKSHPTIELDVLSEFLTSVQQKGGIDHWAKLISGLNAGQIDLFSRLAESLQHLDMSAPESATAFGSCLESVVESESMPVMAEALTALSSKPENDVSALVASLPVMLKLARHAKCNPSVFLAMGDTIERTGREGDWEHIIKALAKMDMDALMQMTSGEEQELAVLLQRVGEGIDPVGLKTLAKCLPLDARQQLFFQLATKIASFLKDDTSGDRFEGVSKVVDGVDRDPAVFLAIANAIERTGRESDWEHVIKALAKMDMDALMKITGNGASELAVLLRCIGQGIDPYELVKFVESLPASSSQYNIFNGTMILSEAVAGLEQTEIDAFLDLLQTVQKKPQSWVEVVATILDADKSTLSKLNKLRQLVKPLQKNE